MKILLLSHDLDAAKSWIQNQQLDNMFILDERDVALQNTVKYRDGFLNPNYTGAMVENFRILQLTFKSQRPFVMLMDMRHYKAVDLIPHDYSVLYYDGSLSKKLFYNRSYSVDLIIDNPTAKLIFENKQLTTD
jgi:hypothetical protein